LSSAYVDLEGNQFGSNIGSTVAVSNFSLGAPGSAVVVEAQVVDDATGTLAVSGGWGLPAQILVPFGGDASNEDIEVAITCQ
jgi:hypothetical protein